MAAGQKVKLLQETEEAKTILEQHFSLSNIHSFLQRGVTVHHCILQGVFLLITFCSGLLLQNCLQASGGTFTKNYKLYSPLLHLLSKHRVLHSGSQHSEEEGGDEGAQMESHPGDGVGQQNLLPLPVHSLHNFIGQNCGAHAVAQLAGNNCSRTDTFQFVPQYFRDVNVYF